MELSVEGLRRWAAEVFEAAGLREPDAEAVAGSLAYAEERGIRSHGFIRVPVYLARIAAGGIRSDAEPVVVADAGALAVIDAGHGPGAASATFAAGIAVRRARRFGIGGVVVREANHFGAAGFYANAIADEGCLALVAANSDKAMCAPAGGERVLGTNPIAIALPVEGGARPQLDMATSQVSLGKLLVAAQLDDRIPLGWAVDRAGRPTTSASAGSEGALLPAAGPKGFGLAFMVDGLVALGGALTSPNAGALYGDPAVPQRLGFAMIAVRADVGLEPEAYARAVAELSREVHESAEEGSVLVPGEPELIAARAGGGRITIAAGLVDELEAIARRLGVPFPSGEAAGGDLTDAP